MALSAAGEAGAQIFSSAPWKVESRLPIASCQFCGLLHVLSAALLLPTRKSSPLHIFHKLKKELVSPQLRLFSAWPCSLEEVECSYFGS